MCWKARLERVTIEFSGKAAEWETNPIQRAILIGLLSKAQGTEINYVNAPAVAGNLGLRVEEIKTAESEDYAELITVRADSYNVAGTFFGSLNNPRIVRINDMPVEAIPAGVLFIMTNADRPGIVGWIGTIMGKHGVNIASMSLGRDKQGGRALTVINLDSAPGDAVLAEIRADKDIYDVKVAKL